MKVKKTYFEVDYRTNGGSSHDWCGYAIDEDDAWEQAHNESYMSMVIDDWMHSVISISEHESDYIYVEED